MNGRDGTILAPEAERRRRYVENTLRPRGLKDSPAARSLTECYVSGDVSDEELEACISAFKTTSTSEYNHSDRRSLAVSLAIVKELDRDPHGVLEKGRANIRRWQAARASEGCGSHPHHREWESIIGEGPAAVRALLTGLDHYSRQMRSSSPFAGVLPEDERLAAIREAAGSTGLAP